MFEGPVAPILASARRPAVEVIDADGWRQAWDELRLVKAAALAPKTYLETSEDVAAYLDKLHRARKAPSPTATASNPVMARSRLWQTPAEAIN